MNLKANIPKHTDLGPEIQGTQIGTTGSSEKWSDKRNQKRICQKLTDLGF